jgi:hypothetical protein
MTANKCTIIMHFVLMITLVAAAAEQVVTEGQKFQIIYDGVCFVTNMGIAFILYLANGGNNNGIKKPTTANPIIAGHGSVGLDSNGNSSLRCDIAGTEYSDKRSYSAGQDIIVPSMERTSSHNTQNTSLDHIDDEEADDVHSI